MVDLWSPESGSGARDRIEILGVFGSGKTTLARRLARTVSDLLLEDHHLNPFWGDGHALAVTGYLPYDLGFLVQHAHLAALDAIRPGAGICDWSFETDRLWASMRLKGDFEPYDAVHRAMGVRLGRARLYVHLDLPVGTILTRLEKRGRMFEAGFRRHVAEAAAEVKRLAASLPPGSVARVASEDDVGALLDGLGTGTPLETDGDERLRRHP